jgi:hypothetical protein
MKTSRIISVIPTDVQHLLIRLSAKKDPDCDRAVEIIDNLYNEGRKKNSSIMRLTASENREVAKQMVEDMGGSVVYTSVAKDEYGWYISIGVTNLTPIMKISEMLVEDCRILIHDAS